MKSVVPIFLALLLSGSAAIGQTNSASLDDHMAKSLQALVANSSANLESYRFFMEMEQKIDLVNLTSADAQRIYAHSFGYGIANLTDRALKLSLASLTYGEGDEENSSAMALEEYLINDTIYLKQDGNWTVLKMPSVADAWSRQNTMAQQLEMINQSRLTLIGSEVVEGQDCYKVQVDMDMGSMAGQLSSEAASLVPLQGMNYSQLFANTSFNICYWITKGTHLLKKTDIVETFVMTPQSLGVSANESEAQEMQISSEISMLFLSYNESVAIELPGEAMKAEPLSLNHMASVEADPVV
jgi:hypothetical protein